MRPELESVESVDSLLAETASPAPILEVPLEKAAGRILQEPIMADRALPPFDRVMMDGFALAWSAAHTEHTVFTITSRQLAGDPQHTLDPDQPNTAIEIMTGATLPINADTVIPYEETSHQKGDATFTLTSLEEIEAKQCIHPTGSDCSQGDLLIEQGTRLGPAETGVAASCGYAQVKVNQLPRIALIGTGDELVPISEQPAAHQIRRSNAAALENALSSAGFPAGSLLHLSDNPEIEQARLKEVIESHDIVIISGAVSRGTADWIAPALDQLATCLFHGVAQRPGKPMGVWKLAHGTIAFGLPGNPVSTLVGLYRHILPFLRRCAGDTPPRAEIELAEPIEMVSHLTVFLPVKIASDGRAHPRPTNNSGDFAGLAGTDGFIELAAGRTCWTMGEKLPFYRWMT